MADFPLTAVIMGPKSGTDRWYDFMLDRDPAKTPADEIVESFMDHLHEHNDLPNSNSYELNSAIKYTEKNVVMVIGRLQLSNEDMPFVAMISWE